MTVYEIYNQADQLTAFEVDNTLLGRRGACRIVRSVSGVHIRKRPVFWSWWREEVFCEFDLGDHTFQIWEPFGDSSRYWIGPEPVKPTEGIHAICEAFLDTGPFGLLRSK